MHIYRNDKVPLNSTTFQRQKRVVVLSITHKSPPLYCEKLVITLNTKPRSAPMVDPPWAQQTPRGSSRLMKVNFVMKTLLSSFALMFHLPSMAQRTFSCHFSWWPDDYLTRLWTWLCQLRPRFSNQSNPQCTAWSAGWKHQTCLIRYPQTSGKFDSNWALPTSLSYEAQGFIIRKTNSMLTLILIVPGTCAGRLQ